MAKTAVALTQKHAVRQRTKETPDDNFAKAKKCLKMFGEAWFEFDQVVADIYTNGEWNDKYEKWDQCAQAEWGMNYRTAMNHVNVGLAIKKFGITLERAEEIGWTNFMEISSLFKPEMTKGQIDSYIKKAAKMTHEEVVKFKQEVKRGGAENPKDTFSTLAFKLKNEAAQVVITALNAAKETMDVVFDDAALEYICIEWLASRDPEKVDEIMKKLKADIAEDDEDGEEEKPAKKKAERKERADKGKKKGTKAAPKAKKKAKDEDEDDDLTEDDDEDVEEDDDDDLLGD